VNGFVGEDFHGLDFRRFGLKPRRKFRALFVDAQNQRGACLSRQCRHGHATNGSGQGGQLLTVWRCLGLLRCDLLGLDLFGAFLGQPCQLFFCGLAFFSFGLRLAVG
jgi:hypothetical protein